jgi:hypothetical protein
MCDFHSICVRKDGAVAHLPTNSHSAAVEAAKWRENQPNREPFFVEAEGTNGENVVIRGEANALQKKVIARHYGSLGKLLADPKKHAAMLKGAGIFSGSGYLDVHLAAIRKSACPVLMRFADTIVEKYGEEGQALVRACVEDIESAATSDSLTKKRGFFFADWAVRTVAPAMCDKGNRPKEAARLRAINQVTNRASADLATREARSVRDILSRNWNADAADADAAAASASSASAYASYAYASASASAADASAYAYADAAKKLFLEMALTALKNACEIK